VKDRGKRGINEGLAMSNASNKRNYYKLLGVPRDASAKEIDEAYSNILKSVSGAEDIPISTELLSMAHKTLLDPEKRKQYDETLPSGIYYYEATQMFDWSANEPAPPKSGQTGAEILPLDSLKAVTPISFKRQVFGNLALDLDEEEEGITNAHRRRILPLRCLKNEYEEAQPIYEMLRKAQRNNANRALLHIGLWAPSVALVGAITYLLLA